MKNRPSNLDDHTSSVNLHSQFIQIGVESGIFAILIYCLFLLSQLKTLFHFSPKLSLGIFSMVSIQSLFNSSFMDHGDGWMLTLVIAYLVAISTSKQTKITP